MLNKEAVRALLCAAGAWWEQDCALCGASSGAALVCTECLADLARVGAACPRCAAPTPTAQLCGQCSRRPPPFDQAVAVFEYRFPLDRLVHRFKDRADLALGRWLARRLRDRVGLLPRPDLLVAPPLTARRLRERGFNQALELAKALGADLAVPVAVSALTKSRETPQQRSLGRHARRANLLHAFQCRLRLHGRHVAVVDDVMTTGATAGAVASELKAAGAARVSIWAVARTP